MSGASNKKTVSKVKIDLDLTHLQMALDVLNVPHAFNAKDVLALSELYNGGLGSPQIWSQIDLLRAYLYYFLPLNMARLKAAYQFGHELGFFKNLTSVIEFGSGPGTSQLAFGHELNIKSWRAQESAQTAQTIHKTLASAVKLIAPEFLKKSLRVEPNTLGVFSYSLCEKELPNWAFDCEALFVVEPATERWGRNLMALRKKLIKGGFSIWAPCTHNDDCPLLEKTKNDWCHMRAHIELPNWLSEFSKQLPMRNDTVTYSYLLVRKTPPPEKIKDTTRVIGDTLYEKGKIRQAICRGSDREYLSWLRKHSNPEVIERGRLITLPKNIEKKGNELRVTAADPIEVQ
jgi:hypothetical protein